ncbi:ABC transporter ATP-binding protein [Psychromonas sp. PT13]|uniref:ABC transporter ATP-binding protein n=1 Tax=Psychromonas sp. PT13 TaxID=3439547 RepID=UPI003EBD2778
MNKRQFIAHCLRLNRKSYLLAVLLIFIVNWLQVEIPRYIQLAIDLIDDASTAGHDHLTQYVWMVVIMSVVMIVVRIFSRIYALNPGRITEAALKNDLLKKLNRLPNAFHGKFSSGTLISIINNDLNGIRLFFGTGILQLTNVLFALSLTPLWMWRISPELTLYSAIPISIAFVIFRMGFKRMKKYNAEYLRRLQDLSAQLMTFLAGVDLIKNQQMSPWVLAEVEKRNQLLLRCKMKITRIQTFVMPVLDYANNLMKILILGFGGYMLLNQQLTLGEITAFLSYSVLLAMPLMQLGRIATIYQRGMVSIESVQRILNAEIPTEDQALLSEPQVAQLHGKTLSVRDLSFSYKDSGRLILDNISFDIPSGKKVGVLGSIGSGKTTLVNCLNHYLDIPKGTVFLDDKDVTTFARNDLHRYIKTVTQNPYLFSDTIEENIRFGSDSDTITKQQVDEVLKLSQLAGDVSRFEKGDQTLVGEKGIMLSGGQKQRLSIARSLLQPCDLIILDDVLSAVDYETERKILQGVFARLENQSALVVSHRVSALEYMDEIIVLNEGKQIAKGSHNELLQTCPYYYETWQLQQNKTEETAC